MNKIENQNSINLEDVQKLTKYQIRLLNMKGGSAEKRDVYKFKVNEYGQRLSKNGVNVDRLIGVIQNGGNPLEELQRQKQATLDAIGRLSATVDDAGLKRQVEDIANDAVLAKKKYTDLATQYGQYVNESTKAFKGAQKALTGVTLHNGVNLPDEQFNNIKDSLTLADNMITPDFLRNIELDSYIMKINELANEPNPAKEATEIASMQDTVTFDFAGNVEDFAKALKARPEFPKAELAMRLADDMIAKLH
jgi:hypothetical protein